MLSENKWLDMNAADHDLDPWFLWIHFRGIHIRICLHTFASLFLELNLDVADPVLYKYILLMIYHYIWKVDLLNTD